MMNQSVENPPGAPGAAPAITEEVTSAASDQVGRTVWARYGLWPGVVAHQQTHGLLHRLLHRSTVRTNAFRRHQRPGRGYLTATLVFRQRHAQTAATDTVPDRSPASTNSVVPTPAPATGRLQPGQQSIYSPPVAAKVYRAPVVSTGRPVGAAPAGASALQTAADQPRPTLPTSARDTTARLVEAAGAQAPTPTPAAVSQNEPVMPAPPPVVVSPLAQSLYGPAHALPAAGAWLHEYTQARSTQASLASTLVQRYTSATIHNPGIALGRGLTAEALAHHPAPAAHGSASATKTGEALPLAAPAAQLRARATPHKHMVQPQRTAALPIVVHPRPASDAAGAVPLPEEYANISLALPSLMAKSSVPQTGAALALPTGRFTQHTLPAGSGTPPTGAPPTTIVRRRAGAAHPATAAFHPSPASSGTHDEPSVPTRWLSSPGLPAMRAGASLSSHSVVNVSGATVGAAVAQRYLNALAHRPQLTIWRQPVSRLSAPAHPITASHLPTAQKTGPSLPLLVTATRLGNQGIQPAATAVPPPGRLAATTASTTPSAPAAPALQGPSVQLQAASVHDRSTGTALALRPSVSQTVHSPIQRHDQPDETASGDPASARAMPAVFAGTVNRISTIASDQASVPGIWRSRGETTSAASFQPAVVQARPQASQSAAPSPGSVPTLNRVGQWGTFLMLRHLKTADMQRMSIVQERPAFVYRARSTGQPAIRRQLPAETPWASANRSAPMGASSSVKPARPAGHALLGEPGHVPAVHVQAHRGPVLTGAQAATLGPVAPRSVMTVAAQRQPSHESPGATTGAPLSAAAAVQQRRETLHEHKAVSVPEETPGRATVLPISLIARRLATTHAMGVPLYRQHLLRPGAGSASTADGPLPMSQAGGQAALETHPVPAVRTSRAVSPTPDAPAGVTVSSTAPHNAAAVLVTTRLVAPPLAETGLPLVQGGQLGMTLQARYLERPAARLFRPLLQPVTEHTSAPIVVAAGQISADGGPATPPLQSAPNRQEVSPAALLLSASSAAGLQRTRHAAPADGSERPLAPPVIQPVVQLTATPGDARLAAGSLVQAQKPRTTEFGAATGDAARTDRLPLVHGGRQGLVQRTGAAPSALPPANTGGLQWSVSQPPVYYPATASAIVQRADAQGSQAPPTYPAAPSGMATEVGGVSLPAPAVDDAQLERMADKVYRIIEQRLIMERESMGM